MRENAPAAFEEVTDEATGQTTTTALSPPGYEPVAATVTAYGPAPNSGRALPVASATTEADGSFELAVPAERVYLEVSPTSADWQPGWLWLEHVTTWGPGFASSVQFGPPDVFDVAPPMDVGWLAVLPALATGRVVDAATGSPVVGARVGYEPVRRHHRVVSGRADPDGRYRLEGLDYDEYHVRVAAPRYAGGTLGGDHRLYEEEGQACTLGPGPLACEEIRMVQR